MPQRPLFPFTHFYPHLNTAYAPPSVGTSTHAPGPSKTAFAQSSPDSIDLRTLAQHDRFAAQLGFAINSNAHGGIDLDGDEYLLSRQEFLYGSTKILRQFPHTYAAMLRLQQAFTRNAYSKPERSTKDTDEWNKGIRRPWGIYYSTDYIDEAVRKTEGRVAVHPSPFPGSRLFVPNDGKAHPALIVLHGSDGGASGWSEMEAIKWAERGFTTLAYAYFGAEGTPPGLAHVSATKVFDAVEWLKNSPSAHQQKVGVYGVSRGAEFAALLGSLDKDQKIDAIIAHSPQDTTKTSFSVLRNKSFSLVYDRFGNQIPAWTFKGKAIPDGSPIQLEKFSGGLFITHGTEDTTWSVDGTRRLDTRLQHFGRPATIKYLEGEGHNTSPALDAQLDNEREAFLTKHLGA